ncbi:MAG: aspartate-semialdehyde dehydrogenase [Pseudothermotoga sp.]
MRKVAVLGATGLVGQRFIQILSNHPFFKISVVAASDNSAGKRYRQAVQWHLDMPIPENVFEMEVQKCEPNFDCDYVFSALPSDIAGPIEDEFVKAGYIVFSNASSHRMDENVPLIVPEVNLDHLDLIHNQTTKGKIVTNPNCSTIGLVMPLKPIFDRFGIRQVHVVTMQAISGAGYPGVASLDILDNVIPYIKNEEEKIMTESKKILGSFKQNRIEFAEFDVQAQCNRVPVQDGHMLSVFIETDQQTNVDNIIKSFEGFEPLRNLGLPTAPRKPLIYLPGERSPQPKLHRNLANGMSVSVGRLVQMSPTRFRFVALVHNTIRGAAGCAILNGEAYELLRNR